VHAALDALDLRVAAESAQRLQTEFLAVLAHELRGPLAPIRTAVGLLGRVRTEDVELLATLRAVIERQIVHVSRMVADLLDMSRLHSGKLRLERQSIDMAKIIDEVADACRPAIASRQQRLSVTRGSSTLPMQGDAIRLTQVLHNLVENASKYTQSGGAISIDVVASEAELMITVSDNGIGITPQALAHVFDAFVQDAHAVD
jgi:signal transduction histidine kinase